MTSPTSIKKYHWSYFCFRRSDYRGIKKLISAIRKSQENGTIPLEGEDTEDEDNHRSDNAWRARSSETRIGTHRPSYGSTGRSPPVVTFPSDLDPPPVELPEPALPLPSESGEAAAARSPTTSSTTRISPSTNMATRKSVMDRPTPFRSKTDVSDLIVYHKCYSDQV